MLDPYNVQGVARTCVYVGAEFFSNKRTEHRCEWELDVFRRVIEMPEFRALCQKKIDETQS